MCLYSANWYIRGFLDYSDRISRLYALFLAFAAVWTISIPIRITFRMRHKQVEKAETTLSHTRLAAWRRNLGELFVLDLIFFGGCFCHGLMMGLASERFIKCNPNIDAIGPFDGLVFISLVGFAGLALIHCVRWFVLMINRTRPRIDVNNFRRQQNSLAG